MVTKISVRLITNETTADATWKTTPELSVIVALVQCPYDPTNLMSLQLGCDHGLTCTSLDYVENSRPQFTFVVYIIVYL